METIILFQGEGEDEDEGKPGGFDLVRLDVGADALALSTWHSRRAQTPCFFTPKIF